MDSWLRGGGDSRARGAAPGAGAGADGAAVTFGDGGPGAETIKGGPLPVSGAIIGDTYYYGGLSGQTKIYSVTGLDTFGDANKDLTYLDHNNNLKIARKNKWNTAVNDFTQLVEDGATIAIHWRIAPIAPFVLSSALISLTSITRETYLWTTLVGCVPSALPILLGAQVAGRAVVGDESDRSPLALAISVLTQPGADGRLHPSVITAPGQTLRGYLHGVVAATWSHMSTKLNLVDSEQLCLLVLRSPPAA